MGAVAYKLDLPAKMDVFHNIFHVSQLRKCLTDQDMVVPSHLKENLTIEAKRVNIIDWMEKATRRKAILMIKNV